MNIKAFFPFGEGPNLILGIGRENRIFFLRTPASGSGMLGGWCSGEGWDGGWMVVWWVAGVLVIGWVAGEVGVEVGGVLGGWSW